MFGVSQGTKRGLCQGKMQLHHRLSCDLTWLDELQIPHLQKSNVDYIQFLYIDAYVYIHIYIYTDI